MASSISLLKAFSCSEQGVKELIKGTQLGLSWVAGKEASEWALPWKPGKRNMVDLCYLVKRYYYNPMTNGSNSLKDVLPAVLNTSDYLKAKYIKPIYGKGLEISSHNFDKWTWIEFDNSFSAS